MAALAPRFVDILRKDIDALRAGGRLPPEARLREHYRAFAGRFGPERLAALNGEALLKLMHQRGAETSLCHWLEARDDEPPSGAAGITGDGGAAFAIHQAGGKWLREAAGGEQEISLHEAVSVAEMQRDELLRGCELLRRLPQNAGPHKRAIDWLDFDSWQMPEPEASRTTFWQLMHEANLIEIERRIAGLSRQPGTRHEDLAAAAPIVGRIRAALARKRQVILHGPPGTGKTYWALRAAFQLGAGENPPGKVALCTFHPGYRYEDFVEGLRPATGGADRVYQSEDGVFKVICAEAEEEPNRNFYLVIDEIASGDVRRIFGELVSVIEKNKRSRNVILPLSKTHFSVPENVFLIGTMSAAAGGGTSLDAAWRRRFAFIELLPDAAVLGDAEVEGIGLAAWLEELNRRIRSHAGAGARQCQLEHAYLLRGAQPIRDFAALAEALQDDIIPLLAACCGGDFAVLERILGPALIDVEGARVRHELFARAGRAKLIEVLRQMAGPGRPARVERSVLAKTTT